jgi:2-oxo-4-hydroxy-4-carboxy-5-ureidoimidazoline decarboxylase
MIRLAELNGMTQSGFRDALAGIFEHSPWVPERAWAQHPFGDVDQLHRALCDVVAHADPREQQALIDAHPQLAGKAAIRGELTDASSREQAGAGLDQCSEQEFAELKRLNDAYMARFGFPFILAVRGQSRASIIDALGKRLLRTREQEFAKALEQIARIARFRLAERIDVAENHR